MRVLALDLALHTGWSFRAVDGCVSGSFHVKPPDMYRRLSVIQDSVLDLCITHRPDVVIIEAPATVWRNSILCTYSLHAMAFYACKQFGARVYHYPPSAWRKVLRMQQRGRDIMKAEAIARALELSGKVDITDNEAEAILMCEAWLMDGRKSYEMK